MSATDTVRKAGASDRVGTPQAPEAPYMDITPQARTSSSLPRKAAGKKPDGADLRAAERAARGSPPRPYGPDEAGENPAYGPEEAGETPDYGPEEAGETPAYGPDEAGESPAYGPGGGLKDAPGGAGSVILRDSAGRFAKGQSGCPEKRFRKGESGNPGGVPRSTREVRKILREASPEAALLLLTLMRDETQPEKLRYEIACGILNRVCGREFPPEDAAGTVKILLSRELEEFSK